MKLFLRILFIGLFLFGLTSQAQAAKPVIFFSDLISGPNHGGQNNKGAFVTIWGKNFGENRGTATVTVGGGLVDNYPEWTDAKISFQLGSNTTSGDIVVTTSEGESNALPFIIREGNIYFITPTGTGDGSYENPFSPSDFIAKINSHEGNEDGAIGYFREGVYNGEYAHNGWHSNFCLDSSHSGEDGLPNAFIAYPGEIALIETSDTTGADRSNFRLYSDPAQHIVVSKFNLYATNGAITGHSDWRIIGNNINAIHTLSGAGAIGAGLYQDATPHHIYIYGNEISGGSSGNKLDHAIYPGSGVNHLYVGWNYIHDNNFGAGPMVSLNSNQAYENNLVSSNIYFYNNTIDVSAYPSRAFGVFETGVGSEVFYYNNKIICASTVSEDVTPTVYAMSANVHYYNNTLYNCGSDNLGANFSFYSSEVYGHLYAPESIELKNNLVYSNSNASYYLKLSENVPSPTLSNNLWYNIASPRSDDNYQEGVDFIVDDPRFISDTNLQLQENSPARNNGITINMFSSDLNGIPRPQGNAWDIGAYEYVESSTIRADVDNNSTINTTDAMLTLRNSLGLNMSNTNWFSSATTGDVNCDGTSNSTDAMLILRHSLGLDMTGTGWCE